VWVAELEKEDPELPGLPLPGLPFVPHSAEGLSQLGPLVAGPAGRGEPGLPLVREKDRNFRAQLHTRRRNPAKPTLQSHQTE
jgi:hypothetical protein